MSNNRLSQLYKWLEEEPNDPFLHYSIGLEILNQDLNNTKEHFDEVLKKFPEYLPTYYQLAKLYERLGLEEEALEIYKKGITLGTSQKNMHAVSELKGALQMLEDELSDEW